MQSQITQRQDLMQTQLAQLQAEVQAQVIEWKEEVQTQMIQGQAQIEAPLGLVRNEFLMFGAKVKAARARASNATMLHNLRPVCKIMVGHPVSHSTPNFAFDQILYSVGSIPPIDLIPDNVTNINNLSYDQMDCIHWFYNEPSLGRGNHTLLNRHNELVEYLRA
ncbi:unnamed protein product [Cuscuta europaea]|uniref:Uncharacterized protein n=1 Tax=Cuscuta europaea TaxID=41803 RepID=A0A9P0ZMW5_CUSEU|nr:unnamed protein product [Cuscuta europaea]